MTKLFVGNLPFSVTSEQLSKKFEKYGTGLVVGHPRSKGFGIVTCSGSVDAAIAEFNGTDWNGRSIIVRRDKDKAGITEKGGRGLFVSPIPEDFQLDEFKALLQQAGSVDDIFVPSYNNKPKNFALVTMSSEADAEHAIEVLNNVEFQGAQLTVHYDKKFRDDARTNPREHKAYAREGERAKPRVTAASNNISLFVGNLAYSTSWQSLKDLFSQYGPVVRANINLDYDGKPKGNGTVIMASLEDAEKAIDNLNEYTLDGRAIRVKMDGKIITGPRIRVSNLPENIEWQDLKELFRPFHPRRADVHVESENLIGVVVFGSLEDAELAFKEMEGAVLNGSELILNFCPSYQMSL